MYAQSSSNRALDKARAAWADADFDIAPALFETALEVGGLSKPDVVDAYVRIGSSLAILGKKKTAIAAFRKAALLDPNFQLPPEAGKKASSLAKIAKRQQARSGGALILTLQVGDEVDSGAPFGVDVTISPPHAPLVDTLSFSARDPLAGHAYERTAPADTRVHFDVPTRMTLPDATLVVQVQAHDAHDNELWAGEKRVHVAKPLPAAGPGPIAALEPSHPTKHAERASNEGGGFWHTAWPYVLGGVALAAGGAATWFATRPTDNVYVGQVRVELR